MSGYETRRLQDVATLRTWQPLRLELGVQAFGINAWSGDEGDELIGAHDERKSGHEELYLVVQGSALFTIAEETFTASAGTVVFVRDPALRRAAVADTAGTTILTVGAAPGEAYLPPTWELNAETFPLFDAGDYAQAQDLLERALTERGENAGLLYNLACAESRLGETDKALEHLLRAAALDAQYAGFAQEDEDFEAIRGDERFPTAFVQKPPLARADRTAPP